MRGLFLVKVLNVGKTMDPPSHSSPNHQQHQQQQQPVHQRILKGYTQSGLTTAHVDVIDPQFRRFSTTDIVTHRTFSVNRVTAIQFLISHGRDLFSVEGAPAGVLWGRTKKEGELCCLGKAEKVAQKLKHIVYLYAHNSTHRFLSYFRSHFSSHSSLLVVVCGEGWKRALPLPSSCPSCSPPSSPPLPSTHSNNIMRISQFGQGHGVVTAGAGACGEFSDTFFTFGAPQCFLVPLSGQKEQFFNAVLMKHQFGDALEVCLSMASSPSPSSSSPSFHAPCSFKEGEGGRPGWEMQFECFLKRVEKTIYQDESIISQQLEGLGEKMSAEEHAAKLLFHR